MKQMVLPESTWLRLRTQLDCLATLLADGAQDALEHKRLPGKWSGRENLAHLARYQNVFLTRLERIRTEDRPILPAYRAENDAEWTWWASRPAAEIFDNLRIGREELIRRLKDFSESELARSGIHSRLGEMSLLLWLEFFLLHEAHHLLAVLQQTRE